MDMNKIRYFCTIVKSGSLVEASQLLGISQPALSKAVKSLEQELGNKLLIPSGRGIAITDQGLRLAEEAIPLLEKIEELRSINSTEKSSKILSIATFEVFSTYFLGDVLSKNFTSHSSTVLELIPGIMEDAILRGEADIGISYLPVPHKDLDILKVTSVEMGIYGNKRFVNDHVDFLSLPFVSPVSPISGAPSKTKGLDGWPDHIQPRNIKYRVGMMETALDLCRRGVSVGYFPSFVINIHNSQVKSQFALKRIANPAKLKDFKQDVYMIKRKSDLESSNFKKISKALRAIGK